MKKIIYISNSDYNSNIDKTIKKIYPNYEIEIIDVSSVKEYLNSFSEVCDKLIISSSIYEVDRQKVIKKLCSNQNNYYVAEIFDINYFEQNVMHNNEFIESELLTPYNEYKYIDKLQIPIAEHCNLKCNRCYHFSNIKGEMAFYDINKYKEDLMLFNKMGFKVYELRLLGGEPLLCNNIFDFIEVFKNIFPCTNIKIVTNGLLLLTKDDDYLRKMSELNVIISISLYPPLTKSIQKIEDRLKVYNVKYDIFRAGNIFNKILTKNSNENYKEIANECEKCILLYNGIISRCAPSVFVNIFNKRFNQSYPEKDFKLLADFHSRKEVLKYLDKPVKLCHFCTGDSNPIGYEWEPTTNEITENDYIR
ncbi:MAG: hypothetical protein FWF46_08380 [Oscillospiraceae bacterium]|nr:hypothetical protein [Oscillospiraceae bacterium]